MEVDDKTVDESDELNQNEVSEKTDTSTPDLTGLSEEKGIDMETTDLLVTYCFIFSVCTRNHSLLVYYRGIWRK